MRDVNTSRGRVEKQYIIDEDKLGHDPCIALIVYNQEGDDRVLEILSQLFVLD